MSIIKQFTFFDNYYEVIKELPNKEEFAFAILEYVFDDVKPTFDGLNKGIWNLIEVPLNNSKKNGKNGKIKSKSNPKEIENKSKRNRENDFATISISSSISNSNNLEKDNRVVGKEEKTFKDTDDTSSLVEMSKKVIDYLNTKTGSAFRYNSKATQTKINARLNEGYKLDDFIVVIDKKYAEWKGTEFEKYLCPETLFGTKFEKYLNQKETKKAEPQEQELPHWFGKKTESGEPTPEEEKEFDELLEGLDF